MKEAYNYQALPPGTMIQEYRIERVLAQGGFGFIYIAKNQFLPEIVAIKEFLPGELATRAENTRVMPLSSDLESTYQQALGKFLEEARTLFELGQPQPHRNIVRVTRYHEENGTAYMVMDYEKGQPLSDILGESGTLPETKLIDILFPLLNGLETVHSASITHRDIKPDNILIRPDGSPVLIDFGAARRPRPDGQKSQIAIFTPNYAAPEQFYDLGEQGPWTDIYALGATLYRAVTGGEPTNASARLRGEAYHRAVEVAAGNYTPTFLEAIDAALELQPENRPQSIAQWRALFERRRSVADDAATRIVPVGSSTRLAASSGETGLHSNLPPHGDRRRGHLFIWVSELGLVAVGGLAALIWLLNADKPTTATTPPPQPEINKVTISLEIQRLAGEFGCARVLPEIDDHGRVFLTGYLSSRPDLKKLRSAVSSIPGVRDVAHDLQVHPEPFCRVLGLLSAFQTFEPAPGDAVSLQTNKPNRDFKEGELLVVYVTASASFSGYLYVDYFDSAGTVVHMLPSPIATTHAVQAGQQLILGDRPCPECYEVSPPHGRNMVIAISSTAPLFDPSRPEEERLSDYLPVLRAGLERLHAQGGKIISTFEYITTHE